MPQKRGVCVKGKNRLSVNSTATILMRAFCNTSSDFHIEKTELRIPTLFKYWRAESWVYFVNKLTFEHVHIYRSVYCQYLVKRICYAFSAPRLVRFSPVIQPTSVILRINLSKEINPEAFLEHSRTSTIELFCNNS